MAKKRKAKDKFIFREKIPKSKRLMASPPHTKDKPNAARLLLKPLFFRIIEPKLPSVPSINPYKRMAKKKIQSFSEFQFFQAIERKILFQILERETAEKRTQPPKI